MSEEITGLSKKERQEQFKEQQKAQAAKEKQIAAFKKWGIIALVILLFVGGMWWGVKELSKPLPGQQFEEQGREHDADISDVKYNSNPPTSGEHFGIWAKRGIYDRVLSDGYLIHSLEHGYIVASYNCDKLKVQSSKFKVNFRAYAQEDRETVGPPAPASSKPLTKMKVQITGEMSAFTPENPPDIEVELPASFQTDSCKKLVKDLSVFLDDYQRIIIVPRVDLDVPIALTAWTRVEKFGTFDREKMDTFVKAFHNKGPERTIE